MDKVRLINKVRIRMKRRKISTRLFQMVTITVVLTLFLYFIFQAGMLGTPQPLPDFTWLSTRNMSVFLRPGVETSLVLPSPCQDDKQSGPDNRLLVAVFSAPTNTQARSVIRRTWGKKFQEYPGVKLIFMLGKPADSAVYKSLVAEAEDHNDVVVEDFLDTYLNLTLKTTFLLKWLQTNCHQTKFIFKVDDDVFVNTDRMWNTLESSHLFSRLLYPLNEDNQKGTPVNIDYALIGHVMQTVPIRDPSSKWYIPPTFYPLNVFPKFLSGTGYVFTGSLVPYLYRCALKTPFINLEDVFLSGLCATTQLELRLTHNEEFVWRPMAVGGSHTCYFKQSVTVHGSTPEHMEEMWARSQDNYLCDTVFFSFMTLLSRMVAFFRNILRI